MMYIYILELESNKYYVGKTTNVNFQLDIHFTMGECLWTNKYKPLKLINLISNCDNFDEDKETIQYMKKYGVNNVRGGSFCQKKLSSENKKTIKQIIKGSLPVYYEYLHQFVQKI